MDVAQKLKCVHILTAAMVRFYHNSDGLLMLCLHKKYLEKKGIKTYLFDISNVRIFNKEIEKKKMEDVYAWLCLRSAVFRESFGLRNRCYSKISVVKLLGYNIAGIS